MKVDFGQELKGLDGTVLYRQDGPESRVDIILRDIVIGSLLATGEKDDGAKKYALWKLAEKVSKAEAPVEVLAEEVVLIKERVGRVQPVIVVGSAFQALEAGV